ncbi:MAG: hypothetical protein HQL72_08200 [Magnetococcales bacterium]|nr:hypothetical protein [Magnetococcales bacterium]
MMQSDSVDITVYGLFWLLFGLLHSVMASEAFKGAWRRILGPFASFERLIFNGVSVFAIMEVFSFARHNLAFVPFFQPIGMMKWSFLSIQGVGLMVLIWSFTAYDIWRFLGLKQIWAGLSKHRIGEEPMVFSLPHQFVRHPLYSGTLLIIWFRPMTEAMVITNLFATLYLLIGLNWEEKRLLALYGASYRRYQQAVPALIPRWNRRWQPTASSEQGSSDTK